MAFQVVLFFKIENEKDQGPYDLGFMVFYSLYSYWSAYAKHF